MQLNGVAIPVHQYLTNKEVKLIIKQSKKHYETSSNWNRILGK
jgi:hypothetical protein